MLHSGTLKLNWAKKKLNEDPCVFLQTFQMQLAEHLYTQDTF